MKKSSVTPAYANKVYSFFENYILDRVVVSEIRICRNIIYISVPMRYATKLQGILDRYEGKNFIEYMEDSGEHLYTPVEKFYITVKRANYKEFINELKG